jgi:hypothetical protein
MKMTMHMCIDVRGVLSRSDKDLVREWGKGALVADGKLLLTARDIRDAFFDELSQGHEVIPFGKMCEGFDYKKGCPGHEVPDEKQAPKAKE